MSTTDKRPTFAAALIYKDPGAALDWLKRAFGFEISMRIESSEGAVEHAEMKFGEGYLMIGGEWMEQVASPQSLGGRNTQTVHVHLEEDVDAHCERARAAGAVIAREPEEQFYGDRTYRAVDLEDHIWTFAQTVRAVSREEAEEASGLKIDGWM